MEDTTAEVKQLFRRLIMSRSEEERFMMCAEMFDSAREIIRASMPKGLSEAEERRYIYEVTYNEPLTEDF